jgi:hypothetical protein
MNLRFQTRRDSQVWDGFDLSVKRKVHFQTKHSKLTSSDRYKLKRISAHGEAGSVDPELVEQEKLRIREVLARFPVADRWNVDESGLFPFAPPDRGLAKQQMSGKKANKFRLTLCFACNANGSERKEVFFIGKSKNPRCFGKRGPRERGFYYRNNETAWMTEALFEEWVLRQRLLSVY